MPLYREVSSAILHLKRRKAPGVDGIPADLIRASGLNAVEALYRLSVKIWRDCSWPDIWKIQEIVLLHKGGSPKDCTNYRTIALLSHASKILLIILLNRLRQKFEDELPDEQAGFRRGRGTADMLCCIQNVIEKTLQMSARTFIVFIDYSKAFDSVSHIQMFDILNDMGFPRHIVALIQALYEKQSAVVRWNGAHTKPFFIEKGVRQGCILSPLLFCAYTEQVMREAEITESGVVIGGRSISNLRYADDTALCGKSPQEINNIVHKVNDAGRKRLLKLNARKTKLMVVGDENTNVSIDVDGETIDKVNSFKYLGAIKTSTGSCSEDVKARIGRAKKATMELDTIWKDRGIRKELKMKLVKALIWPVITYGAEGWTLKKDDERRLEAAEMWCYRRMLRISWTEKRTNKSILNELQTRRELLAQIIKRKMAFFGHACRNNKCNLVKTCILGMMSGKRRRGRPRMQYIDNIKKWTRASLEENVRLSEDRSAWRERSCAAGAANVRTDDAD